jgi:pilus assembly protein CpaB
VAQYDAQKLVLAQQVGSLSLALRSVRAEQGQQLAQRVSNADLGGGAGQGYLRRASYAPAPYAVPIRRNSQVMRPSSAKAIPTPASKTRNVEVIRGTAGSNYEVGDYRGS